MNSSRVTTAAAVTVSAVAAAVAGPRLAPHAPTVMASASAVGIVAVTAATTTGWKALRTRLGSLTALAAVALVWAAALAALAAALPSCGPETGRCSLSDVATYGGVGVMFVGAIAAVAIPPVIVVRAARHARRLTTKLTGGRRPAGRPRKAHRPKSVPLPPR